jgi:outer membrane protein OmpA-like peptidoglycan-associated protein
MKRLVAFAMIASTLWSESPTRQLAFVACPVVRDTKTSPCWLADYNGETYFLGVQGGVVEDFYPPQLRHEVLVEGIVAPGPRVCGGIPLKPVKTSVLLELAPACNTVLPAEDGLEAPARAPRGQPASWLKIISPKETEIYFDFDNDFLSIHTVGAVQKAATAFLETGAKQIDVTGYRGATLLSNGKTMMEAPPIAKARTAKVVEILAGLGVPAAAIHSQTFDKAASKADGAKSRRVVIALR